jgi:hypothetical protein
VREGSSHERRFKASKDGKGSVGPPLGAGSIPVSFPTIVTRLPFGNWAGFTGGRMTTRNSPSDDESRSVSPRKPMRYQQSYVTGESASNHDGHGPPDA